MLEPVWDEADGADGFVSLEVSPSLAHDTDGTLEQARTYWERVDRPNVMIKIPGTEEGLPAIEQAIYEGINVNVTLLFKVESYVAVAERFIRGLERRHEEGKSLDIHSVASFFVSRVDTEVDQRLEELGRTDLQGLAGVANAREAYMRFKEIFLGRALRASCATPGARCSARCGRPPGSRTPSTATRSTSTSWWRRTRSTPCRWPPCTPLPSSPSSTAPPPTRTRPRS